MSERELMERIATCDPTWLLMHIEEDTAYDAAILRKVFDLAKEQARAALSAVSAESSKDGAGETPAAYLSTNPREWGGSRIKPQGNFTIPVYTRPSSDALKPMEHMSDDDMGRRGFVTGWNAAIAAIAKETK